MKPFLFLLLISGAAMGGQRGDVMTLEAPATKEIKLTPFMEPTELALRTLKERQTVVVEYKEKVLFYVDNSDADGWLQRDKEFETRLNAMAWIKKRKQQAINGEDYPAKDFKTYRVTKEEIR